ncbi:MAG: DNA gyrase subunit A [Bacillota bacterium]
MTDYIDGKILPVDIEGEMRRSYIDYAMSVIVSRALPDVRDGLKPVHRRILFAMREAGNTPDKPYRKAAVPVGDVLGKYHPHGDAIVYDALVRMAQDFALRHPLVEGHGNFGSIDGDPPAAMRYTEARLSRIAMELLRDIDKETVAFQPNFDDSTEEPKVLPARFPNLLVNGSAGIAVGMATNIPPHNLAEIVDGCIALLDDPDTGLDTLTRLIPGPDFPTGALILGKDGIAQAYRTGRGLLQLRARACIEDMQGGKQRIVVTELPYQVNKAKLIERIAELVREKKLEGITDLRDESDRTAGLRVVVELKREANARVVLNKLFKYTSMQQTFGVIMLALVGGRPEVLDLRSMLAHYLDHQRDVITRRTAFELRKAEARAHILEGLRIALEHLDAVIALIRASRTVEEAHQGLMATFGLSDKQAQAILDMRLQKLTGLERDKVEAEHQELQKDIEYYRAVLANPSLVDGIVRRELTEVRDKYADDRRTQIVPAEGDVDVEDLIAEEDVVITLTHQGYIKRLPATTYRTQRRGGRGVTGMGTKEEDFVEHLFITSTHHHLLFLTSTGRLHRVKVHELPEAGRAAKGTAVVNLLPLEKGETVHTVIPVKEFEGGQQLVFATKRGVVKKTALSDLYSARRAGIIAIDLDEGDELISVKLSTGRQELLLVTEQGQAARFPETEVRTMGRGARGVKGLDLDEGDAVVAMEAVADGDDLLVVTAHGMGKRTPLTEYPTHHRGGSGVRTMDLTDRSGPIRGARMVRPGEDIMLITANGIIIRVPVDEVSQLKRITRGVAVIRLDEGDSVVAVAKASGRAQDD